MPTGCREPSCDRYATVDVNLPGEGFVGFCKPHADAVLKLARENGMGLGIHDPEDFTDE